MYLCSWHFLGEEREKVSYQYNIYVRDILYMSLYLHISSVGKEKVAITSTSYVSCLSFKCVSVSSCPISSIINKSRICLSYVGKENFRLS